MIEYYNPTNYRFLVSGTLRVSGTSNNELYYAQIDTNGVLLMDTTYGGTDQESLKNTLFENNSIVMSSLTFSYADPHPFYAINASNGYFLCIDTEGTLLWENVIWSEGFSIEPTIFEHGLFHHAVESPPTFAGQEWSYYFGQVDLSNGSILWADTVQEEDIIELTSIQSAPDGGFVMMYRIENDSIPGGAVKLRKVDSNLNTQWERIYSNKPALAFYPYDMEVESNGEVLIWGGVLLKDSIYADSWLIKLDSQGCLTENYCGLATEITETDKDLQIIIYPNPSDGAISIDFPSDISKSSNFVFQIIDNLGRVVYVENIKPLQLNHKLDFAFLSPGSYVCNVFDTERVFNFNNKIIIK